MKNRQTTSDGGGDLNLGLLLFIPYRAIESRVLAAIQAAGFVDLTIAQARVFQRIGPDGTRLTELAQAAQVTKQTAGFLVDQLEKSGYVERVPDPSDARARLIRVTTRGADAVAVGAEVIAEIEAEWTEHLGRKNVAHLRATLSALRDITDPYQ
ncbi:MarR family winged helix-turn-helix transcriptional regulator [Nakamurella sp. GG22]